jgi:hypothetical protein
MGTGVNPSGMEMCAHSATSAVEAITIPDCVARCRAPAAVLLPRSVWLAAVWLAAVELTTVWRIIVLFS